MLNMIDMTKEQENKYRREWRKRTGNAATKKYEKTHKGFLMRKYRNMQSRVEGIQWRKAHLYEGKQILPRDDFYDWAISHPDFLALFDQWIESNYDRKLSPTVDRIDSSKGYILDNMQWITHSENSKRGALSRFGKL